MNAPARAAAAAACLAFAACAAPHGAGLPGTGTPAAARAGTVAKTPKLIFHDEFDGASLDTKIWYRCFNWADEAKGCQTQPGELEWYQTANVTVSHGMLHLTARHQTVTSGKKTYRYTSGMIQAGGWPGNGSTPTFSYEYGYAEVRARLPAGSKGMWPSFWLLPADNSWPPEVDIMEWQGVTPDFDLVTLWWALPHGDATRSYLTPYDLSKGFHTYGFDWQPSYADFYFDRHLVMHYAGANVPHKAMFPILNLAIGGWEKGQLDPPAGEFPTTYDVDYVRVWTARPF